MADKKISLKIAIDGEAEFKQQLQSINSQLKTLGTESKKLDAIYADNANSYEALSAKVNMLGERYELVGEKVATLKSALSAADAALEKHKSETDGLYAAQMRAQDAYNSAAVKTDELKKALDSANAAYARNQESIQYVERRIQTYTQQLNSAEAEQANLSRELSRANTYLDEAADSADKTATSIDRYGKEIKDAGEDTKEFGKAAEVLAQAIVASGAVQGAEKLRDAIVDTAKASIEYESAFAGVRKTVDGTAEELQTISDGIKQMSLEIPMASKELAGIAENAGQLGIATKDVLGFTEVVAALSVTTNLTADQAAVDMARIANITKLTSDEYSNFGSALVALGNDSAAFESEILAMTNRLAAAGSAVGATEAELLGIATTLVSVGIEAEAGGTAVSKLFRQIELAVETGSEKVQQYAEVAGMSATQFAELWRTDATGAVTAFIEGLGGLEEKGQSSIAVLNDMGITEQRLLAAVTAVSEAEGLLSKNVELSNTAWAENTALADEAAVRYETTESRIQILNNAFNNLKITVGDELLKTFGGAIDGLTDLTKAADEYVKKNPEIVAGLTAVAAGVGGLAVAGTVIPLVTTLWGLLSANPASLAVAGILALVTAVATFAATLPDANDDVSVFIRQLDELKERTAETQSGILDLKKANEEQAAAIRGESEEIEKAIKTVEELGNKTDLTASESEILKAAMDKLNGSIPGLKLNYDNLNDSLEDTVYYLRLVASAQALVDEALAKSELRDSLENNFEQLDKDIEDAQKSLNDANTLLNDYIKLRDEYVAPAALDSGRAKGIGGSYNPYDNDVENLRKAVEEAEALLGSAIGAREANKRQIIEINTEIANLDAQYAEKAEAIKKAMETLKTESEDGTEEAGKAFELFKQKIVSEGNNAQQALIALNKAVEAGFNKGLVQKLYEGGSETQKIFGSIIAEFARLEGEYGKGSKEAQTFVNEWNAAWMSSAQSSEALEKQVDKLFGTTEKASEATKTTAQNSQKAIDYIGESLKQQAKDVKSSLDTLVKDYESAYSSVKSTLEGSAGMFEPLIFESDKTVQQMNEIWLSQADYFDGYLKNLERMVEVGFSEGVIAKFSDGSEASAGYAQKIVTDLNNIEAEYGKNSEQAKEFVQNTNESYGLLETNIDKLATFIAEQQTDFSARKDAILTDAQTLLDNLAMYSGDSVEEVSKAVLEVVGEVESSLGSMAEAVEEKGGEAVEAAAEVREEVDEQFEGTEEIGEEAGENYVKGMVEGIDKSTPLVVEAGKELAQTLEKTVNSELGIHSPSKVGEEQGEFYDLGIAKGILDNGYVMVDGALKAISELEAAAQSAARAAGESIGGTIASSAAQEAGRALREMAEKGELTYNGNKVGTAASAGIPNLSGQEAADWNTKLKAQYGLPSNWTNQDITDWLNGGGFMSGSYNSGSAASTASKVTSSVKQMSSTAYIDRTQGTNSHYYDAVPSPKYRTVTVNQTFNTPVQSPYQTKMATEQGIKAVLY